MLKIKNLHAGVNKKIILKNINLEINKGEFHVIMGRNGTGKSTLSNLITGKEEYYKEKGELLYNNEDLIDMLPEERANKGIFMSFQYPVSIPGVNSMHFLRIAVNSIRKSQGNSEYEPSEFIQMLLIAPKLIILDETDSGLDIDALKIVSKGINDFKNSNNAFLLITHYNRILEYLEPDYVHVLLDGKIVKTGNKNLAIKLEEEGYGWLE